MTICGLLIGFAPTSWGCNSRASVWTGSNDITAGARVACPGGTQKSPAQRRSPSIAPATTTAPRQYVWTPACGANRPGTAVGTVQDVSCGAATQCADGSILMALWSAPAGTTTWSRVRNQCLTTAQAVTAAAVVIPSVSLEDVRRLNLPAGTVNVEPAGGHVALNIPTNVYAQADPVTRQLTLLGFDITVEATPVSYTWDFGDGGTLGPTRDAGGPYPAMTTTHTYAQPGTYAVTLTTAYTAGTTWPVWGSRTSRDRSRSPAARYR